MYSVVMATMLAAGSATPDWHHHRCYSGCHGCYSCYSCYSGCGCYGFRHHGHWGGYGCYGCYSGYACYGGYCGCYSGCYSGCYCSGYYGCCTVVYSGCYGCCYYGGGVIVQPAQPRVIEVPQGGKKEEVPLPKKDGEVRVPGQQKSRVTVSLPADARLWVDNVECPLTSTVRSFDTPALNPNQQYVYTLKMQTTRDGQLVTESRRAIINPGQPVVVEFGTTSAATATATASR